MTDKVVAVREDAGFKQMVDVLADFAVSAVPVVDAEMNVLGVVSEADLLHKVEFAGQDVHAKLFERPGRRVVKAKAVGDTAAALMTAPAITIGPDATIGEAARLMEHRQVKRLPVVNAEGKLCGIVSRRDLLRPYLRADEDIQQDVTDQVLTRTLLLEPQTVGVVVRQGRVTLRGRLDRRSSVEIATRLTGAIDGVVTVIGDLTWEWDDTAEPHRFSAFDAQP
jgi:CBS domain-containing protein